MMSEEGRVRLDPVRSRRERRFTGCFMWPFALHVMPWVETDGWTEILLVTGLAVFLPAMVQWFMERQSGAAAGSVRDKKGFPAIVGCSIVLVRWIGLYLLAWYLPGFTVEGPFGPVLLDLSVVAMSLPLWIVLSRMRPK